MDNRRLAVLSLWAIPGFGPKALASLEAITGGDLSSLLNDPPSVWAGTFPLSAMVRDWLDRVPQLRFLGERLIDRAQSTKMGIAFQDANAYPVGLRGLPDAPPVLFFSGTPGRAAHRLAMVGARHPDHGFLRFAQQFAYDVASEGVAIVSGGAIGVDRACHWGALQAGGETWAFLGSGLDELDAAQSGLKPAIVDKGGILYTELPPGVRASPMTFPRRNRLISGAADAVLILRAGIRSGSLHTALAAEKQGRPLLAIPGDPENDAAAGCNALIRAGRAQLCTSAADVMTVLTGQSQPAIVKKSDSVQTFDLSEEAHVAYKLVGSETVSFEQLLRSKALASASLTAALGELELMGLLVQYPGKLYERT